jgi:hypothetical protein
MMLSTDDGLENEIVYPGPEQTHVNAYLLKMLTESAKGPLEAEVILF